MSFITNYAYPFNSTYFICLHEEYRRTRSGRIVKTPPVATKQAPRKTRKKMVLMEIEVSEDEEADESKQKQTIIPQEIEEPMILEKTVEEDTSDDINEQV